MGRLRVGVLVSGRGSNLQALLDKGNDRSCPYVIALVVSNHADAYALRRAADAGVPCEVVERHSYQSRSAHQTAMVEVLRRHDVQFVVMAGFDRVLTPQFVSAYAWRIINIHPSLLPSFPGGLHAQSEAYTYGVKVTGCTVHFVTEALDAGPIIGQTAVPVLESDTVDSLSERILSQEHILLPQTLEMIARGQVRVEGRRVHITAPAPAK